MSDDLRNAEIVRRYLAPESICVIARDHGLTRQRIQQIVTLEGASRDHLDVIRRRQKALLEREKRAEAAARISAFFARVIELRATGLSWTNTAASLGVPYAHLLHRVDDFRARHPDQVGAFGPWTPRPERRKSRPPHTGRGGMTETGRTRRNFDGNPDRGNKLSLKNPRGLRGGKFGAAGPVTHIDPKGYQLSKPAPSAPIKPPRRTKKPKLPTATLRPLQRRPYQPFDQADAWKPIDHDANPAESARRFNIIEAMYPR